jgi:MFS family permease
MIQASIAGYLLFSPERQTSAAQIAFVLAVTLLPYSLVGPAIGVIADVIDRRNIVVYGNSLRAAVSLVLLLVVLGSSSQALLAVTILLLLGIDRFVLAVLSTVLPRIVSGKELVAIDGYLPTLGTVAAASGAAVAVGISAIFDSITAALIVAALLYACSAIFATGFKKGSLGPDQKLAWSATKSRAIEDVIAGVSVLIKTKPARYALISITAQRIAFGAFTVASILTARAVYQSESQALAVVAGSFAIAAIVSGIIGVTTPTAVNRMSREKWLLILSILSAIAVISAQFTPALIALGLAGFAVTCAPGGNKVLTDERLQVTIPDTHRGRAFAIYDTSINSAVVIGAAVCALLSDYIQIFDLLLVVSLTTITLGWIWSRIANSETATNSSAAQ